MSIKAVSNHRAYTIDPFHVRCIQHLNRAIAAEKNLQAVLKDLTLKIYMQHKSVRWAFRIRKSRAGSL